MEGSMGRDNEGREGRRGRKVREQWKEGKEGTKGREGRKGRGTTHTLPYLSRCFFIHEIHFMYLFKNLIYNT